MLHCLLLLDLKSKFCLHGLNAFLSFYSIYIPSFPYIFLSAMFLYCLTLLTFILPFFSLLQSIFLCCWMNSNTKAERSCLIFMIRQILTLLLRNPIYAELIFLLAFSSVSVYKYFFPFFLLEYVAWFLLRLFISGYVKSFYLNLRLLVSVITFHILR